jgi:hypothetical protein
LNFPLATDPATQKYFLRNKEPRNGEPGEFRVSPDQQETYADIALLPNLAGTGTVLILNGIDMAAAEAAAKFAMDGSMSAQFPPSGFAEVVIRVRAIGGTVESTEVVARREAAAHK